MKQKKIIINKSVARISLSIIILIISLAIVLVNQNNKVVGKIYFNKPVSWEQVYAYVYDEKGKELLGKWPGIELTKEEDYIIKIKCDSNEAIYKGYKIDK